MTERQELAKLAVDHLRRADPHLRPVIDAVGGFALRLERNHFWMLSKSILSQQLSSAAARTIKSRVAELLPPRSWNARSVIELKPRDLHSAGVSKQKAEFILGLAEALTNGELTFRRISQKPDDAVIDYLTGFRGIGRWTAQMFLIFSLGRMDVYPDADAGVRGAMRAIYGLNENDEPSAFSQHASLWKPYASVASWYCWQSIDLKLHRQQPKRISRKDVA